MNLNEIRERRAALVQEARALVSGENVTAEQKTRFDELKAEIEGLEADERRAAFLEECERRSTGERVSGEPAGLAELETRVSLLRVLQAQVAGRALDGAEAEYNREIERRNGRAAEGVYLPLAALETRANTTGSAGELVADDHRADLYIPGLRDNLLARRLGVRTLTGLRGNLAIPKHGTSVTAGWVAENSALTPSDMTFGDVSLSPKHVGALSEMSRQLIQQSDPSVEQLLRDDMSYQIAKAIDAALIVGGGSNEPDGVIATLGSTNGTLGTPSRTEVLRIIEQVEADNALSASHAWLTTAAGKAKLAGTLKESGDAGAGYLYADGRVGGYPLHSTGQVPTASGGDSAVIFGDWSQVFLGVWSELDVLVNPYSETAYTKGNVLVRAMATCDAAIRHAEAFVYADDLAAL